ncbi:zinc ABC transporter substrate-binding protein ZnuA [Pseudomonas jilinensis]|uniref:High-affinity zinc uptake system protein ZnuA n=2 Tax=Pseudomonas jilinensis TaxID=2078689 RepID=A0A396RYT2_9PSED|nr:zinc ABC transporter substrate-binding protein ZnuA [Pseudomonas jilinensis]RHW20592.1 zinc ABC transporter substrate-binding protein ZnuA [Pseudomonas jilinensis]
MTMLWRFLLILLCGMGLSLSALADTPRVLTTIKPLQLIAAAVLDGIDQPAVLLPTGASPHSYALRPSDRRALQQAERIYWVGPELELFLERLLKDQPRARAAIQQAPALTLRTLGPALNFQHAERAHDHLGHDHDHHEGMVDAHIWLAPANAQAIARWMAADLVRLYPGQQARLQANLAAFEQRLEILDQDLVQRLTPLQGKPYFVFHDAYGYFEDAYGLRAEGVFSLSHEVQPGARHVNLLRQRLSSVGPSCVFREPQFPPRLIDSLSEGLNVFSGELDPLGSEVAVTAQGYEVLLRELGDNLATCLERL